MHDLAQGQPAPDFTLPRDGGGTQTLSDLRGGPVVLFFYPKDNTPGCTKEAVAFTGLLEDFAASGALKVALLSDAEADVCETYGVWGEKKMYGKTFEGITRTTVLIDAEGRIARVWPKVKVDGHAEEVLEAVRAL
jgi:peroxiredoxin Q/BCP